jgi:hypothetical protein
MNSIPSSFWGWVASLDDGLIFAFIFFASLLVALTVAFVSVTIYKMHKNRLDDALKRELLDRGMSAEEIAAVICATPTPSALSCSPRYSSPGSHIS